MMTRLKKKIGQQKEELSPFIDEISKLPVPELITKIEGDGRGSRFSNQELICMIKSEKLSLTIRRAAYLSLVISGWLKDLQSLATIMDFSVKDTVGNDAFRLAAIYDRLDVMVWLRDNVDIFKNITTEERTNIILHVVSNDREEVLEALAKPIAEGGFGWDLNVKHQNGFTPVKMALKDHNKNLLLRLIAPVEDGGFGLKLEKNELRRLNQRKEFALFSGMDPRYRRSKPERKMSSFTLVNDRDLDDRVETYTPEKLLGSGSYGSVRLFSSSSTPEKKLVVKQVADARKKEALSGFHVYVSAENAVHELQFLQRAYPDDGPYKIQHYVINNGTGYDCRMIMPFVQGQEFREAVLATRSAKEMARLLLAIAEELQRIHAIGIVHGDPRPRNILTHVTRNESGEAAYKVHFVDFYYANNIGRRAHTFSETREDIPPEQVGDSEKIITRAHPSQDVFVMGFFFKSAVKYFEKEMSAQFPSIMKFCESCTKEKPDERPKLQDFIRELKADLGEIKVDENRVQSRLA